MKSSKCLIANPDVIVRKEEEDAFLFNPEDGNLICVNSLGAFIWKHCDGSQASEKIITKIQKEYTGVSKDKIVKDFDAFVKELQEIKFLKGKK